MVIWKEFKLANSFTVEASFYGYLTPERQTVPFTPVLLFSAGQAIIEGVHDYLHRLDQETLLKDIKRKKAKTRKLKSISDTPKPENPTSVSLIEKPSENLSTLEDLPEETKEDEALPETLSDDSDGDSSEDDLEPADQQQLHEQIAAVMEEFSELSTRPKAIRQSIKSGNRRAKRATIEAEARSHLEMYFSKAAQSVTRCRSNCKAVIPKVYDSGMIVDTKREIRSVSLKAKDALVRHLTHKDLGKRQMQRGKLVVEQTAETPGKAPTSSERTDTRLSVWLGRRMRQTEARDSTDSEDDQSTTYDSKPFPLIPSLRPIRFPSVHETRLRKSPPKPRLSRQFSTDISYTEK